MRIRQFELATGMKRSTIRFYERKGLIVADLDPAGNGYRRYGPTHVERALAIRAAQRLGFSLDEIGSLVTAWERGEIDRMHRRCVIAQKLGEIDEKINHFKAMKRYLVDILAWIDGGEAGSKPAFGDRPGP